MFFKIADKAIVKSTMASQSNNISLSENTSILLRQILEVQQQQAMLVQQQQQAMPASQLQAQTLQETGTETEVVTSNNETQTQEASLSNDDFTEILINEVQSMPILWLRICPDYKRADKKKIVWANIAAKLKCDGEYCMPIV